MFTREAGQHIREVTFESTVVHDRMPSFRNPLAPASSQAINPNTGPVLLGEAADLRSPTCVITDAKFGAIDGGNDDDPRELHINKALNLALKQVEALKVAKQACSRQVAAGEESAAAAERLGSRVRELQVKLSKMAQEKQEVTTALEEERARRSAAEAESARVKAAMEAAAEVSRAEVEALNEASRAQVEALKRECTELQQRNKALQEAQARSPPQQPVLKPSQQSKGEGQVSLRKVMLTRVLSPGGRKVPAAGGRTGDEPSVRPCSISPVVASPVEESAESPVAIPDVSIVPTEASANANAPSPLASSVQAALSWISAQEQQDEPLDSALALAPDASVDDAGSETEDVPPEQPKAKPMKRSNSFKRS